MDEINALMERCEAVRRRMGANEEFVTEYLPRDDESGGFWWVGFYDHNTDLKMTSSGPTLQAALEMWLSQYNGGIVADWLKSTRVG